MIKNGKFVRTPVSVVPSFGAVTEKVHLVGRNHDEPLSIALTFEEAEELMKDLQTELANPNFRRTA